MGGVSPYIPRVYESGGKNAEGWLSVPVCDETRGLSPLLSDCLRGPTRGTRCNFSFSFWFNHKLLFSCITGRKTEGGKGGGVYLSHASQSIHRDKPSQCNDLKHYYSSTAHGHMWEGYRCNMAMSLFCLFSTVLFTT